MVQHQTVLLPSLMAVTSSTSSASVISDNHADTTFSIDNSYESPKLPCSIKGSPDSQNISDCGDDEFLDGSRTGISDSWSIASLPIFFTDVNGISKPVGSNDIPDDDFENIMPDMTRHGSTDSGISTAPSSASSTYTNNLRTPTSNIPMSSMVNTIKSNNRQSWASGVSSQSVESRFSISAYFNDADCVKSPTEAKHPNHKSLKTSSTLAAPLIQSSTTLPSLATDRDASSKSTASELVSLDTEYQNSNSSSMKSSTLKRKPVPLVLRKSGDMNGALQSYDNDLVSPLSPAHLQPNSSDSVPKSRPRSSTTSTQASRASSSKSLEVYSSQPFKHHPGEQGLCIQVWIDQEGFRASRPEMTFSRSYSPVPSPPTSPKSPGRPNSRLSNNPTEDEVFKRTGWWEFDMLEPSSFYYHSGSGEATPTLHRLTLLNEQNKDFLSHRANLVIKAPGKYRVQGMESVKVKSRDSGSIAFAAWRFDYIVAERLSSNPKTARGEMSITPLRFSCSPELLDANRAKKLGILHTMRKTVSRKNSAMRLDNDLQQRRMSNMHFTSVSSNVSRPNADSPSSSSTKRPATSTGTPGYISTSHIISRPKTSSGAQTNTSFSDHKSPKRPGTAPNYNPRSFV